MKRWWNVRVSSFDPNDRDFCWSENVSVFTTEADCVSAAFRNLNRPSKNTRVYYREDR